MTQCARIRRAGSETECAVKLQRRPSGSTCRGGRYSLMELWPGSSELLLEIVETDKCNL